MMSKTFKNTSRLASRVCVRTGQSCEVTLRFRNTQFLPWNLQTIFTVDELSGIFGRGFDSFVDDTLGSHIWFDGSLNIPDMSILFGHFGTVESRVKKDHSESLASELFGLQSTSNVACCARHVVTVVATLVLVLGRSPFDGTSLRRDDDELSFLCQGSSIDHSRVDAQWTQGTNVNLLQLFVKVEAVVRDLFTWFVKISSVVDDDINVTTIILNLLRDFLDGLVISHIDS
mmetsp:Transcript_8056/g.13341  ORF Transcript_8056/g.13341 Transcript_8056/m.13341 type:complete len:230 (+) Transcript_8056:114-803(+)